MANLPIRQQWTPERSAFVQSLLNEFPLYSTRSELPSGFYLGMPLFMQDGRVLRISQSEEPNQTGKEYGLVPGRISYWAGSEFTAVQSGSTAEKLVNSEGRRRNDSGPPKTGSKTVKVTGLTAEFQENIFNSGTLRVTGGSAEIVGHSFLVGGNTASTSRTATATEVADDSDINSGDDVYDITLFLSTPLPFDFTDATDIYVQGNIYGCQRFSPPHPLAELQADSKAIALDFPQIHTGTPTVKVPNGHYYWNIVSGPATGQLQEAITEANCEQQKIELTPFYSSLPDGDTPTDAEEVADFGKLIVSDSASGADFTREPFARLVTRTKTAFAADSYAPIWIYER